jgi:hypothetical protein
MVRLLKSLEDFLTGSDDKIFVDADKTKLRRELDGYNNTGYYYKLGTNLFLYEFMGNIDKICTARN